MSKRPAGMNNKQLLASVTLAVKTGHTHPMSHSFPLTRKYFFKSLEQNQGELARTFSTRPPAPSSSTCCSIQSEGLR